MDQQRFELNYQVMHRHKDGSWAEMQEVPSASRLLGARPGALVEPAPDLPLQDLRGVGDRHPGRGGRCGRGPLKGGPAGPGVAAPGCAQPQ